MCPSDWSLRVKMYVRVVFERSEVNREDTKHLATQI